MLCGFDQEAIGSLFGIASFKKSLRCLVVLWFVYGLGCVRILEASSKGLGANPCHEVPLIAVRAPLRILQGGCGASISKL